MANDWPRAKVGEIARSISDTHPRNKTKLIFLNTSDVLMGKILHAKYSSTSEWPGQAKKSIKRDDILFSEIRPANGHYAYVDIDAEDYVVSTKLMVIRTQSHRVVPKFLYHFLTSPSLASWLQHLAESRSGTFPQITFDQIAELEVSLPPLRDQLSIANFLDLIDDKIALNQHATRTLENVTQALFESWFVDFDPARAKAEGRDTGLPRHLADLFPDSFKESELGEIPSSWPVLTLGELSNRVAMGPFGSNIKTDNFVDKGVPVIRGASLVDGFVDENFVYITERKADELRNSNAFPGDVVITHRGTLGQVGLIPQRALYPRYVISQSQMLISADLSVTTPKYLFEFLRSRNGRHQLLANISQTGVPAISRPTTSLKAIRVVAPPLALVKTFDRLVSPMIERIVGNRNESRTLSALRGAVLPRLISGELRVSES